MMTLEHLEKIGTRHDVPKFAPLGGGKDLLLLDYIDVYMITMLSVA
jgi:hypothetical protein